MVTCSVLLGKNVTFRNLRQLLLEVNNYSNNYENPTTDDDRRTEVVVFLTGHFLVASDFAVPWIRARLNTLPLCAGYCIR